jgi:hypothetical protein
LTRKRSLTGRPLRDLALYAIVLVGGRVSTLTAVVFVSSTLPAKSTA